MTTNPQPSDAGSEIERVLTAAGDAITDQMVERLAVTSSNALEVLDRINDDDTRDAIMTLIDQLTDLHRAGGLTSLFEVVHMINAGRNAMTDGIVERLAIFAEHMVSNLGQEEVGELAHDASMALCEARKESMDAPSGGLMATLRLLSKPETQQSLQFLMAFAGKLREKQVCRE